MTTYVYAIRYGALWRFTRSRWMSMLRRIAAGLEINFRDYGVMLAEDVHNITDLDQQQARERITEIAKTNTEL